MFLILLNFFEKCNIKIIHKHRKNLIFNGITFNGIIGNEININKAL